MARLNMARPNLQIKVGTYLGNGADNTNISGIGFRPQFLLIKSATATNAPFRTNRMLRDATGFISSTNSNLADYIQELLADGFQLGTVGNVNGNGTRYFYLAIGGKSAQSYFHTGRYYGDGNDNRNFTGGGVSFTPDMVLIQQVGGATQAVHRTSAHVGDVTSSFDTNSNAADRIQSLIANGFQLGTDARVNIANGEYVFVAMKQLAGAFAVGTYRGDGSALKAISGLGFKPDCVIVKVNTTQAARILTADMVTNNVNSLFTSSAASDAVGILSLDNDGFSVGSGASVNNNNSVVTWMAFKSGDFNAPLSRTTV